MNKSIAHLEVSKEDHKDFKVLAKIEGVSMRELFNRVVKKLKVRQKLLESLK